MGELLKLFERFVKAVEAISETLAEMHAEGITIKGATVKTAAAAPQETEEEEEETEEEEEQQEEETEEEDTGDDELVPEKGKAGKGKKDLSLDDVRAKVRAFAAEKGEPAAVKLLKKYKAGKISEIKPEHFAAIVADIDKQLD